MAWSGYLMTRCGGTWSMFIAARAVVWPLLAAFFPLVCHDRFQKPNSQEHVKHVESQETDSHVMGMFLSIIL